MAVVGFGREKEKAQKSDIIPEGEEGQPQEIQADLNSIFSVLETQKGFKTPKGFEPYKMKDGYKNVIIYNNDVASIDNVGNALLAIGYKDIDVLYIAGFINKNGSAIIKRVKSENEAQKIVDIFEENNIRSIFV